MQIFYETGDMFDGPQRILVHGCNAKGVMGSGVAKIIRERYPLAYEGYRNKFLTSGLKLGDVISVNCGDRTIINAVTQDEYGRDKDRVYVDYDAIRLCMNKINNIAKNADVGMPLIGAGLANGNWGIISDIIQQESHGFQPVVWLLDGVIPS